MVTFGRRRRCWAVALTGLIYAPLLWFDNSRAADTQSGWLCVSEVAGGLVFNPQTKSWHGGEFNEQDRIVIRPKKPGDIDFAHVSDPQNSTAKWSLEYMGRQGATACNGDFDNAGYLRCETVSDDVIFNKNSSKFQLYYWPGYMEEGMEQGNTPLIEIGHCAPQP